MKIKTTTKSEQSNYEYNQKLQTQMKKLYLQTEIWGSEKS